MSGYEAMKSNPAKKFRFPLPKVVRSFQVDHSQISDVEKIEDRLYQFSCRIYNEPDVEKKSLLVPLRNKDAVLASEVQSELSSLDIYIKTKSHDENEPSFTKIDLAILNQDKRNELKDLAVGAQKADLNPKPGKNKLKKIKKEEREKTKGPGWFGMAAPEMTEERQRDLEILQMRSALDPRRFYKKNDLKTLPKYFQIGHVLDSPVDYYSDRRTKKERKKTLVDELMADAEFKKNNKRKYVEIIEKESKLTKRYHKHKSAKTKRAKT